MLGKSFLWENVLEVFSLNGASQLRNLEKDRYNLALFSYRMRYEDLTRW